MTTSKSDSNAEVIGGTFTITTLSGITEPIPYNASQEDIEQAIEAVKLRPVETNISISSESAMLPLETF
jgi:hypothetical protein